MLAQKREKMKTSQRETWSSVLTTLGTGRPKKTGRALVEGCNPFPLKVFSDHGHKVLVSNPWRVEKRVSNAFWRDDVFDNVIGSQIHETTTVRVKDEHVNLKLKHMLRVKNGYRTA